MTDNTIFQAGFANIDITPPLGTAKIGMLKHLTIERIADRSCAAPVRLRCD